MRLTLCTAALVAGSLAATAHADRETYERRAIERLQETFLRADHDRDGQLTRVEATGAIELEAAFDDMDSGRDGIVSAKEFEDYLAVRYRFRRDATGAAAPAPQGPPGTR